MPETGAREIAHCPNPQCGETIREDHPYSWCSKCGERLPDSIQHQLTKLREMDAKAQLAREVIANSNAEVEAVPLKRVEAVARLYRRLVLLVGLQIAVGLFQIPSETSPSQEAGPLALMTSLILLVLLIWIAITAYGLTKQLGESLPILWAILMFFPCLNIIVLLVLSSRSQTWCHRYGIKVGLLGPTKGSIEEIRRHAKSEAFD